jgi:hypothetical protein
MIYLLWMPLWVLLMVWPLIRLWRIARAIGYAEGFAEYSKMLQRAATERELQRLRSELEPPAIPKSV